MATKKIYNSNSEFNDALNASYSDIVPDVDNDIEKNGHNTDKPHHSEMQLKENINRLSHFARNQITLSLILKYVKLFISKHKPQLLVCSVIMAGVFIGTHIWEQSLIDPTPTVTFSMKLIYIVTVALIGTSILRSATLSHKQRLQTNFFKGFLPFLGLHIMVNLVAMTSVFMTTNIFMNIDNELANNNFLLGAGTIVTALISSTLLTRFSYIIPAMMRESEDTSQTLLVKMQPYFKPLFFTLFLTKCVCLNIIVFSDSILTSIASVSINTIMFVVYHIFIYSLIGTTFKLSQKN